MRQGNPPHGAPNMVLGQPHKGVPQQHDPNYQAARRRVPFPIQRSRIAIGQLILHVSHMQAYANRIRCNNNITYWRHYVREYFDASAIYKYTFIQETSNGRSRRSFEIHAESMARMFETLYTHVREVSNFMEDPKEWRIENTNVLFAPRTRVLMTFRPEEHTILEGHLRVIFSNSLKVLSWEFEIRSHKSVVVPGNDPKAHIHASGLPAQLVFMFEIAEVVYLMEDIMEYTQTNSINPSGSLKAFLEDDKRKPPGYPQHQLARSRKPPPNVSSKRQIGEDANQMQTRAKRRKEMQTSQPAPPPDSPTPKRTSQRNRTRRLPPGSAANLPISPKGGENGYVSAKVPRTSSDGFVVYGRHDNDDEDLDFDPSVSV